MNIAGTTAEGEPFIRIALQVPQAQPGFTKRLGKEHLERYQLERYRADRVLRDGTTPFEAVSVGNNPPDFVVGTADGRAVQVDLAALPLEDWRNASRLFQRLLERMQS